MRRFLAPFLCLAALPAAAQSLLDDCSGWQAAARNIPEPVEQHTRTFANGAVRVTLLDTVEPAAGAFYLQILSPPYDELGGRSCAVIAESGGMGLAGLDFSGLTADYDPATGLTFRLPASRFDPNAGDFVAAVLAVQLNQSSGEVVPWFEAP